MRAPKSRRRPTRIEPETRGAMLDAWNEGLRVQDIAQRFDRPTGTIASVIHQARRSKDPRAVRRTSGWSHS